MAWDQYNDYGLSNLRLVEKSGAGQYVLYFQRKSIFPLDVVGSSPISCSICSLAKEYWPFQFYSVNLTESPGRRYQHLPGKPHADNVSFCFRATADSLASTAFRF